MKRSRRWLFGIFRRWLCLVFLLSFLSVLLVFISCLWFCGLGNTSNDLTRAYTGRRHLSHTHTYIYYLLTRRHL